MDQKMNPIKRRYFQNQQIVEIVTNCTKHWRKKKFHTKVDISGKGDSIGRLDQGKSRLLLATEGLEVTKGASFLVLAIHSNVNHTELKGFKVDHADSIEGEIRDDERPFKEGVVGVSYSHVQEDEIYTL